MKVTFQPPSLLHRAAFHIDGYVGDVAAHSQEIQSAWSRAEDIATLCEIFRRDPALFQSVFEIQVNLKDMAEQAEWGRVRTVETDFTGGFGPVRNPFKEDPTLGSFLTRLFRRG